MTLSVQRLLSPALPVLLTGGIGFSLAVAAWAGDASEPLPLPSFPDFVLSDPAPFVPGNNEIIDPPGFTVLPPEPLKSEPPRPEPQIGRAHV